MKQHYDNIDEYISDLKKEIAANDKCANHYYNLGMAFLHKRDFVAAEEAFLDALRNSPHLAEIWMVVLAIMNKPPHAVQNFPLHKAILHLCIYSVESQTRQLQH